MSLYPEGSTDGGLRLGNIVPDFKMDTTHGKFDSFHEWKKGKWAILFSHPADFTPVCTTEIGRLALKYDKLSEMDCLVATLSVDPVKSHNEWLEDVVAHCENKIEIKFPIIGDQDRSISMAYGMIDPGSSDEQKLPLTIRAVFIINPENKLMLSLNYPACVGRNMDEIVRCVEALQLSYEKSIAVSICIFVSNTICTCTLFSHYQTSKLRHLRTGRTIMRTLSSPTEHARLSSKEVCSYYPPSLPRKQPCTIPATTAAKCHLESSTCVL